MNAEKRNEKAVLLVLSRGPATFSEIALRGGEGLYPAIERLVRAGKVIRTGNKYALVDPIPRGT